MSGYILRRILLMIPTLIGIMFITFSVTQFVPGGPVERLIAQIEGHSAGAGEVRSGGRSLYQGSQGLDPERIEKIRKMYGFDKPAYVRFFRMARNYMFFDFGDSFFRDRRVISLIIDKMPVLR